MNESDYKSIAGAIRGGGFLIGAAILFAGAAVADAVQRSSETNAGGGSFPIVVFLNAILFFILGIGALKK